MGLGLELELGLGLQLGLGLGLMITFLPGSVRSLCSTCLLGVLNPLALTLTLTLTLTITLTLTLTLTPTPTLTLPQPGVHAAHAPRQPEQNVPRVLHRLTWFGFGLI